MDSQQGNAVAQEDRKSARKAFFLIALPTFVLVLLRETAGGRTVLLTQIPIALKWVAHAYGFIIGCIFAYKIINLDADPTLPQWKAIRHKIFIAIAFPVAGIFIYSYLFRWAYEIVAFSGINIDHRLEEVKISQVMIKAKSIGYRVDAKLYAEGREVEIFVNPAVYDSLRAVRPRLWQQKFPQLEFCFKLPVDHGRWGAARAHVPAFWDDPINTYGKCSESSAAQKMIDEPQWPAVITTPPPPAPAPSRASDRYPTP